MAGSKTQFTQFVIAEAEKYRGVSVPLKSGLLKRIFIRKVPCKALHPNPNDEFCDPGVGPSYEIIAGYEERIRDQRFYAQKRFFSEPVIVEKIRPDGYMILNGHHRWAASLRMGLPAIWVRVVNLTHMEDIRMMLRNAKSERRVTLDLDEVVFSKRDDGATEKALPFPFGWFFRERLISGVPALFRFLNKYGWDIWVYTAQYYSLEYIKRLFARYHVHVSGIVTGAGRGKKISAAEREQLSAMVTDRYHMTLHIDNNTVLCVDNRTKAFEEHALSGTDRTWSREVMDVIAKLEKNEQ